MNLFYCYTILTVGGLFPLPDSKVEPHDGLLKFALCGAFSGMRCIWCLSRNKSYSKFNITEHRTLNLRARFGLHMKSISIQLGCKTCDVHSLHWFLLSGLAYLQLPIPSPQRSTVMSFHHPSNAALFLAQLALQSRPGNFDMSDK